MRKPTLRRIDELTDEKVEEPETAQGGVDRRRMPMGMTAPGVIKLRRAQRNHRKKHDKTPASDIVTAAC